MKRKYWVLSPNVSNNSTQEHIWKKVIAEEQLAFMGWNDDHDLGKKFKNDIQLGDIVTIAQGANRQKKLFLAGVVASQAKWELFKDTPEESSNRRLNPYLEKGELEKLGLDFNGTAFGTADRIPSLYQLYPDKTKADRILVEKIESAINKKTRNEAMKQVVQLLQYKKQIILQGPPGTGKTRLAKKIVSELRRPKTIEIVDIKNNIKINQEVFTISDKSSFIITGISDKELTYRRTSTQKIGTLSFADIQKGYANQVWGNVRNGSDTYSAGVSKYIYDHYVSDRYKIIQFHPSYTYEDFVRGIVSTPNENGDGMFFKAEDKILADFARQALSNYMDSRKQVSELSKERALEDYFNQFVESIEIQLEEAPILLKDTTISILDLDADAFWYKGVDGWSKKGNRMLFKDIKQSYLDGNTTRQDFKKNKNLSGIANHHASYFVRVLNLFKEYLKEKSLTFNNLQQQKIEEKNYIIIIDEINRANLSAVLGELIYTLEYRGEEVDSMYNVEGSNKLVLPPNLLIIGTMNTADRSVGHIDYAIRRRFAFFDVQPKDLSQELGKDFKVDLFKTVAQLFDHNTNLSKEFDNKEVQLGHSYFIQHYEKDENGNDDKSKPIDFNLRLQYEIKPILLEYVRDGILIGKAGGTTIEDYINNLAV